jgi:hypothetical protein
MIDSGPRGESIVGFLCLALCGSVCFQLAAGSVFNVKDYGATGARAGDARPAIQKAIEACAAAGGGVVCFPPGEYTSGTLHLRSHVRIEIQAGATLFASTDPQAYDFGPTASKAALFSGEDLVDVSIGGRGTVDGQAQYEWRLDDFERAFDHKILMQKLGQSLLRSVPKGFPKREVFPHLIWLGRSKDLRIAGLNLLHSPSWTIALYACEQAVFDRLNIQTSLTEGVWADGIDLDGCREVTISNCTIATGDDCIVFISTDAWGPALPCENIKVTGCRLSSASAGVKFSEGNRVSIHDVLVRNTVLTNVNRGFVFSTTLGGRISDVVLSDLTIYCNRFDWFWAGDGQPFFFRITRLSEFNHEPPKAGEPPLGSIGNIVIRNVTAHAKGSSLIHGHPESRLDGVSLARVRLFVSADPAAPFDSAEHGLSFRWVKNVTLNDVKVSWQTPKFGKWKSALSFEDVSNLELDGFSGRGAWPDRDVPLVVLNQVSDAIVRHSRALDGTGVFLGIMGSGSDRICVRNNDFRKARIPWQISQGVEAGAVFTLENRLPGQ